MDLKDLYTGIGADTPQGDRCRALLRQTHWLSGVVETDPRTGLALPLPLSTTLRRIRDLPEPWEPEGENPPNDRLWRIAMHARPALKALLHNLGTSPARERAVLPIRAVRELDQASFMSLSRRPGRTVREKLASKPYLQAVRRYQSIDIPQNRLLKAFCVRLSEVLALRERTFDYQDDLLMRVDSWLRSSEADEIGRWENLPPNNTLLSQRHYRAVWDAWGWLRSLDEDIARDWASFGRRQELVDLWEERVSSRFVDRPLAFNFDKFTIEPSWDVHKIRRGVAGSPGPVGVLATSGVCIDLVPLMPRYASADAPVAQAPFALLWQHWPIGPDEGAPVDIDLVEADGVWEHPDATTVSAAVLFEDSDVPSAELDRAARAMASTLRSRFVHGALRWLVPDIANDFTLEVLRRNLNAKFADAQPLPRSVATIFAQVDLDRVTHGFSVVVVDSFAGTRYATKLSAHFDAALKELVPETRGFSWEREPSVRLGAGDPDAFPLWRLDGDGHWHEPTEPTPAGRTDFAELRNAARLGQFDLALNSGSDLPAGGVWFGYLQFQAGAVPLWRDHLPELSIEVMEKGVRHEFPLVSRKKRITVDPRRGVRTPISIDAQFHLAPGFSEYRFPLVQGSQGGKLEYDAVLRSEEFPLRKEATCELELTYEYGADDPYVLRFTPVDGSFAPVRAAWRPVSERPPVDVTTLPVPPFPAPVPWAELTRWPRDKPGRDGQLTTDLLGWSVRAFASLGDPRTLFPDRVTGEFVEGRADHDGNYFCSVQVDGESVHCHSRNFAEPVDTTTLVAGDPVHLVVQRQPSRTPGGRDRLTGKQVTFSAFAPGEMTTDLVKQEIGRARFPTYTIWNQGRSTDDPDCPSAFRDAVRNGVNDAERLISDAGNSAELRSELKALLSRMHVDAPTWLHRELLASALQANQNVPLNVAYGLGDCSLRWQREALIAIATQPSPDVLALAVALWRSEEPVRLLSSATVDGLLASMAGSLSDPVRVVSRSELAQKDRATTPWRGTSEQKQLELAVRRILSWCELLLALLRTRESPDIRMKSLLSPDSEHGRTFIAVVDDLIRLFVDKRYRLDSRVSFELTQPDDSRVPDLLYALRLYLTGDDGASMIRISRVSEDAS